MRKILSLGLALLLMGLVVLVFVAGRGVIAQNQGHPIRLRAGTFVPRSGEVPVLPAALSIEGYAAGEAGYYLVQFDGPVRESWKAAVTAAGGELLGYVPDYAFKVRMTPAAAGRVAALPRVAWVGLFQPAYKLDPALADAGQGLVRVVVERGGDVRRAAAAIGQGGATVLDESGELLLVATGAGQLAAIARVLDVAWIEPYVPFETHNDSGAGVIMGANTANTNGYTGSTQIVAVADTGLGNGTAAGAHADIPPARIVAVNNWPGSAGGCFQTVVDDGAVDVSSGHGTHVAGSVLSDGDADGKGKGTAPAAQLVFQALENWATTTTFCQFFGWPASGYFLTGIPNDIGDLFAQARTAGARIHSNSWGANVAGVYTTDSANTDTYIWNNKDMTVTFSAGNSGVDANANGVVDNDSLGAPATAKNVITIGASENARADNFPCDTALTYVSKDGYQSGQTCTSMSGLNILGTAGQRWGFPAEPLKSDVTGGNAEQMAPFSSRGPADDTRIKPDVVAPGAWILSTYSSLHQEGYGDPANPQDDNFQNDGWGMPFSVDYKYFGGTSMSNPLAAGAAAVVRDYYQKQFTHSASAALVKGTLINTAVDLLDENNDGANDNDFPIPNVHEGWGRISLVPATDGSRSFVENTAGLATGINQTTTYTVTGGGPFKVTLVWSDYPSIPSASVNLVNDLDLVVTAPGGTSYLGNVFSGGWSQTGGSADRRNNVENVYISTPAAGVWTVRVTGFNVPNGPQPYALVVNAPAAPAPSGTATPTPATTATPTSTPTAGPPTPTLPPSGFLPLISKP